MQFPYLGKFRISQPYKGSLHDGLDLVGITDKKIYCCAAGKVEVANYENASNKMQGFGLYVRIRDKNNDCWYYGHLSKVNVKVGQTVNVGDLLGVEGSTGRSTGSHLHICVRSNGVKSKHKDISKIFGIPNSVGLVNTDDYYLVKRSWKDKLLYKTKYITQARLFAQKKKCVVYNSSGKTIYNFRGD